MKNKIIFCLVLGALFMCSCSKDAITNIIDPVVPTTPRTKFSFHCKVHNLTYRYVAYMDDSNKNDSMPCPLCNHEQAYTFLRKFTNHGWQIRCPKDSAWTTYMDANLSSSILAPTLWDSIKWFPSYSYKDVKSISLADLTMIVKPSWDASGLFDSFKCFRNFSCDTCLMKVCKSAIIVKTDSINNWHNSINSIIGLNFTSYPFKTGMPVDRRARAQAILDSIQRILPSINPYYDTKYSTIHQFVGGWDGARQDYIYCKKTGTTPGSYVDYDTYMQCVTDAYISDTVIINIAGGPDYKWGGVYYIPTWKSKSSTNTVQNSKAFTRGRPSLSHLGALKKVAPVRKTRRSAISGTFQRSTSFQPGNVDLLPSQYLPRKYNTYTTSVFNLWHPQKGNQLNSGNTQPSWSYFNLANTVGGWNNKYPYNIVSDAYGELLNDVGVMEIRTVVNWCKARGKKIVLMGSSWGGSMIFDYIRYYGTSDFEQVVIADQNPNIPSNLLSDELEEYIYGKTALQYGTDPSYKEINLNMCVIASDVYRRMEWLAGKNLSNVIFYYSQGDGNVGVIPSSDVATLKGQGAKLYAFPSSIAHGVFQDSRAWYRYITPTQQ